MTIQEFKKLAKRNSKLIYSVRTHKNKYFEGYIIEYAHIYNPNNVSPQNSVTYDGTLSSILEKYFTIL